MPQHIKTISQYHEAMGLNKPEHPLVSLISFDLHQGPSYKGSSSWVFDFYAIALKRNFKGKIKYGQQEYDFDEGIMTFMAPGQVLRIELPEGGMPDHSGWLLLFHPDFLWNTYLAKQINRHEYFGYEVYEALFLSEKEELLIIELLQRMQQEYQSPIDSFTQNIIVAQLEVLLNYADRFYRRQFITRKKPHSELLNRLEACLTDHFETQQSFPTVKKLSESLHVSPNYLSALLKSLTGKSTQQHIQDKVIELPNCNWQPPNFP